LPKDARRWWLVWAFIAALAPFQGSHGAEFDVNLERSPCNVGVTGYIAKGDLAKFKAKLPRGYVVDRNNPTICLDSPGGDFLEGLTIAEYVAEGFSTHLEQGATCGSACSWIFMAGTNQSTGGSSLDRNMHVGSHLFFHAPYLDPRASPDSATKAANVEDVIKAYNQAISEVANNVLKFASRRTTFDLRPFMESSLVMQALINKEPFPVDTVGKAMRWYINLDGAIGLPPRNKDDIVMACRNGLAYANDFWDWDFLYNTKAIEYLAFYDTNEHVLTAQIVLDSIASGACEVRIKFTDDLKQIDSIDIDANLLWELSVGQQWIKNTRGPVTVSLPGYAIAKPTTPLASLATTAGVTVDPRLLTTVSSPAWCTQQVKKQADESTVCASGRLSAFDVLLSRYYQDSLNRATAAEKTSRQSDQRQWLAKRRACGTDQNCLEQSYHTRFQNMREHD
jgi:uncharacterized protein YecT (DUF1311 family)